jgi:cytoskeleton protein RodZ
MAERRARVVNEQRAPQDGLGYDGVGAGLRHARERLSLDLAEVAAALRIQHLHLEALEQGRFQELPGPAYAIGFIRSYARYLRLDDEAAVAQFKAETSIAPGRSRLVAPEPLGEARRPRSLLIGVSLLLAAGVYGGWMWLQQRDRLSLELVPPPPQSESQATAPASAAAPPIRAEEPAPRAEPAPATAASAPGVSAAPSAPAASMLAAPPAATASAPSLPEASAPAEAAVAPDDEGDESENTPPPTANSLPGAPPTLSAQIAPMASTASTGTGQTYGAANHDARVVIRAKAESWVQVKGANNEILLTRTLRPGDAYLAPNRSDITLWTGNAGALEILLDGTALPPLGAVGAPKRDISLDPARLSRAGG